MLVRALIWWAETESLREERRSGYPRTAWPSRTIRRHVGQLDVGRPQLSAFEVG